MVSTKRRERAGFDPAGVSALVEAARMVVSCKEVFPSQAEACCCLLELSRALQSFGETEGK